MKNMSCDCIIPFYNEGLKPINVVEAALKVKSLSKVIVVDDGSIDNTPYLQLKSKFPQITSIRLENNSGKANAIKEGIKYASAQYVLLLDGDLTNIKTNELNNAIEKITSNSEISMIILRRIKDKTVVVSRWIRHDIIFSGQRILRRRDLEKIFEKSVIGYQLEIAINTYMIRNNKIVYWMPSSIHNLFKFDKRGFINGWKIGLKMFIGFITYAGWHNFLAQTLFFCRNKAPDL